MTAHAKLQRCAKQFCIRFDKIGRFIKIHNKIKFLVLLDEWCDKICDKIKCLISDKSGITDSTNHNFAIIRIDSYNFVPIEKLLTFHNVVTFIKPVVDKKLF